MDQVNRRGFKQTSAAATASALALTSGSRADAPPATKTSLPRRPLGKTGVEVTILNQGTWRSPDSLDRLLRLGYANGVRHVDTADYYGSEAGIAKWLESNPAIRKEIFLATKDHPRTPRDLIARLDRRLVASAD